MRPGNRNGAPATTGGTSAQAIKGKPLSLSTLHLLGNHMGYFKTNLPHTYKTHKGTAAYGSTTSKAVDAYGRNRRSSSSDEGLGTVRRPGRVDVQGNSLCKASPPSHTAHPVESSSTTGMEWQDHLITNDETGVRVVDIERALEGERKRDRTSSQAHPGFFADGRSNPQRRLWRGDDLGRQGVHYEGVPYSRGTKRGIHQPG